MFALKCERTTRLNKKPTIFLESSIIHKLKKSGCVPLLYYIGSDDTVAKDATMHFVIMDLLGPSLEDLHGGCKRKLDLKTVLLIAVQLVRHFE